MSNPYPPFGTQDLRDDDPQIIDDLVKTTSAPADIQGAIEPVQPPPEVKPRATTRVNGNTVQFYIGNAPVKLLNEDPDRINCHILVYSLNDTPASITRQDYVIISDESGKVSGGAIGINIVAHHGATIDLNGHTGAVWVVPGPLLTAFIEVSAYAVTTYSNVQVKPV